MGILSRLYGSPKDRETKRTFHEARQKGRHESRKLRPLQNIELAIFVAAQACQRELRSLIVETDDKARQLRELELMYEYIYFFMHLTMRRCFGLLGDMSRQRLQDFLMPEIIFTSVESACGNWLEERKEGVRFEFVNNINSAEHEYGACTELLSAEDITFKGNSLFSILVRNVSEELGSDPNPIHSLVTMMHVLDVSIKACEAMKLEKLVRKASRAIDSDLGGKHVRMLAEYGLYGSILSGLILQKPGSD